MRALLAMPAGLPQRMLDAVKERAQARGIPYQRFVREAIEHALAEPNRG